MLHAEWLRQLLEPALAATLDNDSAATAAASSALTALATLEGLSPGSLQSMMLEVTTLACTLTHAKHIVHTLHTGSNQQQQHTECPAAIAASNHCAPSCAWLCTWRLLLFSNRLQHRWWQIQKAVTVFNDVAQLQVLGIVSVCPDTSPLQVMKLRAQQLFSMQPQPDDLPKDIPDLGTLGNYLLTRHVSPTHLCAYVIVPAFLFNASSFRDGFLVALCCFFNSLAKGQYHVEGVCSVNALQCCVQLMCSLNQCGVHAGGEKTLLMINHRATIQANTPLSSATCFHDFCVTACSRPSAPVLMDVAGFSAMFPIMNSRDTDAARQ